jgi:hypothetical protein
MTEAHESIEGSWYCSACDQYLGPNNVTAEEKCCDCDGQAVWEQYDDED